MFFFFKQKTAYEMRISDWSSDVCSSDLRSATFFPGGLFDVNISGDDPIGYYDGNQFVYLGRDVSASDVADRYGETDRIYNNILNPRTRYLGAATLNFDVSDATELFGQVM